MDLGWFELSLDVKDIVRTKEFYEKLGFRVVDRTAEGRVVTLQKAECRICLYQGFLNPAETQLIFWQGDVEAISKDLVQKGLQFEKPLAIGDDNGKAAMLKDPDGRPVYFISLPGVTRRSAE
jgi:catechol 2,3-dioxygenase-like lactoylglutathione lyase family enzyme